MAKEPVLVICADTHLSDRAWTSRKIDGDAYDSFRQIVDHQLNLEVDLAIAGDSIDKQRNLPGPINFAAQQMVRLARQDLNCVFIQGQHEYYEEPWFSGFPATIHLHNQVHDIGDLTIAGLDFQPAGTLQKCLAKMPQSDVLLCHQVWGDLMGDICLPEGRFEQVTSARLIVTGDYHGGYETGEVVNEKGKTVKYLNPGSTCLQSVAEPHNKYFAVLYDDLSLEKVQLATRRLSRWGCVYTSEDIDRFADQIEQLIESLAEEAESLGVSEHLRTPIIHMEYMTTVDSVQSRVRRIVGDRAFLFFKPIVIAKEYANASAEELAEVAATQPTQATTLVAELAEWCEENDCADLYDTASVLLGAEHHDQVTRSLNSMLSEI